MRITKRLSPWTAVLSVLVLALLGVGATWAMPVPSEAAAYSGGLSNPNIVYMLMLLGLFGLIFEAATPGLVIPGTAGGIALIVALAALRDMPANISGLLLMLLGLVLILTPLMRIRQKALSWLGVVLFTLGAIHLLSNPDLGADIPVMSGLSLASGIFFLWLVSHYEKMRETPSVTGTEGLVGRTGVAIDSFDRKGKVALDGALWKAETSQPLDEGDEVEVVAVKGLVLSVKKVA